MTSPRPGQPVTTDVPIPDRLWDGMLTLLSGVLAVAGVAVAAAAILGWPRKLPAELTGVELGVLMAQAVLSAGAIAVSGRRLCARYPGALAVAFVVGVPAALAVLMAVEWSDPREPHAGWWTLLGNSAVLSALVAVPAAFLFQRTRPNQAAPGK